MNKFCVTLIQGDNKVDIDTSISVPYQTLVDAFCFIYGKGVIINVCSGLI